MCPNGIHHAALGCVMTSASVQGDYVEKWVKVCDKICIFFFFPIINKYFLMAKRSLLSRCPSYKPVLF